MCFLAYIMASSLAASAYVEQGYGFVRERENMQFRILVNEGRGFSVI